MKDTKKKLKAIYDKKLRLLIIDFTLEKEYIKAILEYIGEVIKTNPELARKQLNMLYVYIDEGIPLEDFIDKIDKIQ